MPALHLFTVFTAHAWKLTTEPTNRPSEKPTHRYNLFIVHARIHELKINHLKEPSLHIACDWLFTV